MEQLTGQDPTHIGPYRLIARLGAGGMGLVYLGRSDLGRTVAVKVVQAQHAEHAEFRRRFAREVAAARRVGGAWTADVLDADTEAAVPWVATQYIPGPDLTTVVGQDFGPLPEQSVRTLANRLALALQAVHGAGLIHRDLKPSNVLVTVDGPRVIDFGIARAMDSLTGDSLHTRTGMLIGSPGFMSPEQVRGLELTPASDVFCLGALLVYASTGRLLFGAADSGLNAHLFRIAEEEPDLTGVPDSLVDLVRTCLHKDPAKRPTPQEVAARTATEQAGEWLPGAVLAWIGRRAAHLLDYAPAPPAAAPAAAPAARPDPRILPAQPPTPPPAYAPTAPAHSGAEPAFGASPTPPPGVWGAPTSPAGLPDPPAPHPRRWWGLLVLALAQWVVLFDAASPFDVSRWWDVAESVYVLAFLGLLLFGARIVDRVGRKRMLIISLVGFAIATAVSGSMDHASALDVIWGLQGAFAALVSSSVPGLVSMSFTEPRERRKAFGIYVAVAGSGPALGSLLHGAPHLDVSGQWLLYASIPFAVIAVTGVAALVQDHPGSTGARFDLPGVLLGSGGIAALVYGVSLDTLHIVDIWGALSLLALGGILVAAFVWRQTRTAGTLAAPSGITAQAPVGYFLTVALANVGAVALLMALGWYHH
ncbi:MFS transporter [Streptomyces sp. NPDC058525]|uniref:MFS transporter n=1 Tax=Streptomyces sp. NPDC058525 TaxID=3346538 RepID=UPI00365B7BCB